MGVQCLGQQGTDLQALQGWEPVGALESGEARDVLYLET